VNPETETARFKLLYDLGCAFAARTELNELLPFVIAKCGDALNADGASILLLDRERNEFYFPYVVGADSDVATRLASLRFPADQGLAGAALKRGESIKVDDAQHDSRFYQGADRATGVHTRNLIATPLMTRVGPIGVIEVINRRDQNSFSQGDVHFLEALAGSIAIAVENARFYAQIRESEAKLLTQMSALRRDLARQDHFNQIIGTTPAMAEVFSLMETAAASSITVLITGETGTGKELVARGIHQASARADAPFLAVNCAAMPENLLESELFGHRRGSFTGALRDNPGLFRSAAGGTVFLDEVGDMPLAMQAKLLRVLEEEEVVPVGESFPIKVNVRVLSATNRDLQTEVKRGNCREDLYYRLNVFPIRVPPLRERKEDIPVLVQSFIARAAERHHKRIAGIEPSAMELLKAFNWPGNVRELQNEIERAVALARDDEIIQKTKLSPTLLKPQPQIEAAPDPEPSMIANGSNQSAETEQPGDEDGPGSLRQARAAFEAHYIARILEQCNGNVSRAARQMRVSRVQLQRKVKEYNLR
jgi:transcriptional regulator with GAF, ATPase, and Fis domain